MAGQDALMEVLSKLAGVGVALTVIGVAHVAAVRTAGGRTLGGR